MAETLCPNCGYSPIPAGAEACPECHEPFGFLQMHKRAKRKFVDRERDHEDMEATVFGGNLTGEVAAHPWPASLVLFAGAVAWFLRVGVFNPLQEPLILFGLVLMDLVLALLLLINAGPGRVLTQLGMVVQLGVAWWLGRKSLEAPLHVAFLAHSALSFLMVTGEPGPLRRYVSLGLGLGAVGLAALALALPLGTKPAAAGADRQKLVGRELGFELDLPSGWGRLERAQLEPHLVLPAATLTGSGVAFGNAQQGRFGLLWVDRKADQTLLGGCQEILKSVGGGTGKPLTRAAPAALGGKALVYELRTGSGAQGALGCGQLEDGRLVGLAVVAVPEEREGGEAAFAVVGEGLALQ